MDLHGSGSEVAGWKVVGDGRYMRNVATSGSAVGMWLAGSGNTMHNGNGNFNSGPGILVRATATPWTARTPSAVAAAASRSWATNKVLKVDAGDKGK
jgi:hypothetical protein